MEVILQLNWHTIMNSLNILCTKFWTMAPFYTHNQKSAHEPQQWWLIKKSIHAAKQAGCQYNTPSMHCGMNNYAAECYYLLFLVLFWLWVFSRLFCDVQRWTDFLFVRMFLFLIVTNFWLSPLIVDVCVCFSTDKFQYVNKCILYIDCFTTFDCCSIRGAI